MWLRPPLVVYSSFIPMPLEPRVRGDWKGVATANPSCHGGNGSITPHSGSQGNRAKLLHWGPVPLTNLAYNIVCWCWCHLLWLCWPVDTEFCCGLRSHWCLITGRPDWLLQLHTDRPKLNRCQVRTKRYELEFNKRQESVANVVLAQVQI